MVLSYASPRPSLVVCPPAVPRLLLHLLRLRWHRHCAPPGGKTAKIPLAYS